MALPLSQLLKIMVAEGGDALLLTKDSPPSLRICGQIRRIEHPPLVKDDIEKYFSAITSDSDKITFRDTGIVTFSFEISSIGRFFARFYKSKTDLGAVLSLIPNEIWHLERLGIYSRSLNLSCSPGINLISGAARSGRSTTLAALIDKFNSEKSLKICIIHNGSQPQHFHKRSLVEEIVIRADMKDLMKAVELATFSMEADCVAIDGIYGRDELEALFFAARCGLYCYATVFGQSVEAVIQNILYEWSHEDRKHILTFLSKHLNWILCQGLLPNINERKQLLSYEFLYCTKEVKTLIEIDRLNELKKVFSGDYSDGQHIPMEKSLAYLYFKRDCSLESVLCFANHDIDQEYLIDIIKRGPRSLGTHFNI